MTPLIPYPRSVDMPVTWGREKIGRSFSLTICGWPQLNHFIIIDFMTLGWGLFVGPATESCGQIWLPCLGHPNSPPGMEEDWKHPKPGHGNNASITEAVAAEPDEGKTVSTVFHLNNEEAKRELHVYIDTRRLNFQPKTTHLGVKRDRTLSYHQRLAGLRDQVMERSTPIRKLVGTGWRASPSTFCTSALALVYAPAEYWAPTWSRIRHSSLLDLGLNWTLRIITGCLQPTQ